MPRSRCIMLVAGGTGGHVIPAWASAESLKETPSSCVLVTDPRGKIFLDTLPSAGLVEVLPPLAPWIKGLSFMRWLIGLGRQLVSSIKLLRKHRPCVVVGFGGYPSLAAGLAALILGIPLWIHEQNAVLGRTNRFLSIWARRILLTFPQTHKVLFPSRTLVLGTPIRPEVRRLNHDVSWPQTPFTLLIIGGSQGAQIFGTIIPQALALLDAQDRATIRVIQQCRPDQIIALETIYQTLGINHTLASFFPDVAHHMVRSHALISRAGASTLSEWMALRKPVLFIPYPSAVDDHQRANASWVSSQDASGLTQMMIESEMTPRALALIIQRWLHHKGKRQTGAYPSPLIEPEQTSRLWRRLIEQELSR